jgi:hypothetical protein
MGNNILFGTKVNCCISSLCFSENIIGKSKFQYMDKGDAKINGRLTESKTLETYTMPKLENKKDIFNEILMEIQNKIIKNQGFKFHLNNNQVFCRT